MAEFNFTTLMFLDYGAIIWIISIVETNVSIIFACVHAARPILSRIFPGFFGELNRASSKNEEMKSISISSKRNKNSILSRRSSTTETDTERAESSVERNSVVPEKPMAARFSTPKSRATIGWNMSGGPIMYSNGVPVTPNERDVGYEFRGSFLDI
jgi:hypothetical protein